MRRRKLFEILAISRQDLGSSCFNSLSNDEGVHSGGGTGRPKELPRNAPMTFMSYGHGADRFQDPIDGSVARSPSDGLGHHHHWDLNRNSQLQGSGKKGSRRLVSTGKSDDSP
jgi:hypothetical protein